MKVFGIIIITIIALSLQAQEIELVYDRVDEYDTIDSEWYIQKENQNYIFKLHYNDTFYKLKCSIPDKINWDRSFIFTKLGTISTGENGRETWSSYDEKGKRALIMWLKNDGILIIMRDKTIHRFVNTK